MLARACILALVVLICIGSISETFGARLPELKELRSYESDAGTLMKKHGGKGTECDKRRFRKSMLKLVKEVRCCRRAEVWDNPM